MLLSSLFETPETDRDVRRKALLVLKRTIANTAQPIEHAVIYRNGKFGGKPTVYPVPICFIRTPMPDLIVGLAPGVNNGKASITPIGNNKTTLPPEIRYFISYPYHIKLPFPPPPVEEMLALAQNVFGSGSNIYLKARLEEDKPTFVHEFVHYWDFSHAKGNMNMEPPEKATDAEYYNSTIERNAYYNEAVHQIDRKSKKFFNRSFHDFAVDALGFFNQTFLQNLDEKGQKRVISRLYALWMEKNK